MNKNSLNEIIWILLSTIIGIIAIKFIIWLLPVILIGVASYYIYKFLKKKTIKTKTNKRKKTIKIIDMVEDDK